MEDLTTCKKVQVYFEATLKHVRSEPQPTETWGQKFFPFREICPRFILFYLIFDID